MTRKLGSVPRWGVRLGTVAALTPLVLAQQGCALPGPTVEQSDYAQFNSYVQPEFRGITPTKIIFSPDQLDAPTKIGTGRVVNANVARETNDTTNGDRTAVIQFVTDKNPLEGAVAGQQGYAVTVTYGDPKNPQVVSQTLYNQVGVTSKALQTGGFLLTVKIDMNYSDNELQLEKAAQKGQLTVFVDRELSTKYVGGDTVDNPRGITDGENQMVALAEFQFEPSGQIDVSVTPTPSPTRRPGATPTITPTPNGMPGAGDTPTPTPSR